MAKNREEHPRQQQDDVASGRSIPRGTDEHADSDSTGAPAEETRPQGSEEEGKAGKGSES